MKRRDTSMHVCRLAGSRRHTSSDLLVRSPSLTSQRQGHTVEFKNDYVLGFIICEIFTVITLQDCVGWGIFTVIPGYPPRANSDSQHLEARPELQDWLRSELFTVKITGQGPFQNN